MNKFAVTLTYVVEAENEDAAAEEVISEIFAGDPEDILQAVSGVTLCPEVPA